MGFEHNGGIEYGSFASTLMRWTDGHPNWRWLIVSPLQHIASKGLGWIGETILSIIGGIFGGLTGAGVHPLVTRNSTNSREEDRTNLIREAEQPESVVVKVT